MLIDAGADVNAELDIGVGVMSNASLRNDPDLLQVVVDGGSDCTTLNNSDMATYNFGWASKLDKWTEIEAILRSCGVTF